MKEKIHDFGMFGKWSEGTLKAQSKEDIMYGFTILPESIRTKRDKLRKELEIHKNTKLKKIDIRELENRLSSIEELETELENFVKIEKLVIKLIKVK